MLSINTATRQLLAIHYLLQQYNGTFVFHNGKRVVYSFLLLTAAGSISENKAIKKRFSEKRNENNFGSLKEKIQSRTKTNEKLERSRYEAARKNAVDYFYFHLRWREIRCKYCIYHNTQTKRCCSWQLKLELQPNNFELMQWIIKGREQDQMRGDTSSESNMKRETEPYDLYIILCSPTFSFQSPFLFLPLLFFHQRYYTTK